MKFTNLSSQDFIDEYNGDETDKKKKNTKHFNSDKQKFGKKKTFN